MNKQARIAAFMQLKQNGLIDTAYKKGVFMADEKQTPSCNCDGAGNNQHQASCKVEKLLVGYRTYQNIARNGVR